MIDAPNRPARVLGTLDAACVVIGAIIGVGIFFTPSRIAAITGSAELALLTWAIAGGVALCGALVFAELGGLSNGPGAQYQVLRDSYGPFPAFLFVFCNATAVQAGAIGIIAIICARNLMVAAGMPDAPARRVMAVALALIGGLTGANIAGVRWGARIQNFTVFCKVGALLAVGAIALWHRGAPPAPSGPPVAPAPGGVAPVLTGLVPALFAFGGWQQALWIAGEVRAPGKTLPRAIIGGVVVVIAVYLFANWAYLDLLGVAAVGSSRSLAADAVGVVFPSGGARVIAGAVALSALGVLNAQLLTGPRLIQSLAGDGRFFRVFAGLSPGLGTPVPSILLLCGLAVVLLFAAGEAGLDRLLTGVVFIDSVFFMLTGAALFVLRRRQPGADRPFRVPLYPLVPALFVLAEVGVIIGAHLDRATLGAARIGLAWIAGAALLYAVRFRHADRAP